MNVVIATSDGPLECRGELQIIAPEGQALAQAGELWLCRCGQSANKPHCDGSHARVGFRDQTKPTPVAPTVAQTAEPLRVTPRLNGPLRVDGPCEVRAADGTLVFSGRETALCRCGQSSKKPFCDGTHRQVGFVA